MLRDKRKDVERAYQRQRLELLQQAQQTLDDHQKVRNDDSLNFERQCLDFSSLVYGVADVCNITGAAVRAAQAGRQANRAS